MASVAGVRDRSAAFATESTMPYGAAVGIKTLFTMMGTSMCSSVFPKNAWMVVIEMADVVVGVDGEHPGSGSPVYRVEKIIGCREQGVLPVVENVAKVCISVCQVLSVNIVCRVYSH